LLQERLMATHGSGLLRPGIVCLSATLALASALWSPAVHSQSADGGSADAAQRLPCAWPLEDTGKGLSNAFDPDTDATYWLMPVDSSRWQSMSVSGQYPAARFFSFTTYRELHNPGVVDFLVDADIAPQAGSSNPFASSAADGEHRYRLTIDARANGGENHLSWGSSRIVFVVYRIYVADDGAGPAGGVPLPEITLTDNAGSSVAVGQCPARAALQSAALAQRIAALEERLATGTSSCPAVAPPGLGVPFATKSSTGRFFPNPVTQYWSAQNLCLTAQQVLVIRGRATDFPATFSGGTIFDPALPGAIQMRYWSLCNNEQKLPLPVVACRADHDTRLDAQGFYTYVLSSASSAQAPSPSWLPPDATWLPWGDAAIQENLLFRVMLPLAGFTLSGTQVPSGVICDRQTLINAGWQGCFAAAGLTAP
jgi:hypothetical protein